MSMKLQRVEFAEPSSVSIPSTSPETAGSLDIMELVLAEQPAKPPAQEPPRIEGILIGQILSVDTPGAPRVTYPQGPLDGLPARAMLTLGPDDVGRSVALMFESGDPTLPIIMGRMATHTTDRPAQTIVAQSDGRRVELSADEEIVLRCGESSITLTRAGKIIIRGNYIVSRSSGVNCIQGGSVEIN